MSKKTKFNTQPLLVRIGLVLGSLALTYAYLYITYTLLIDYLKVDVNYQVGIPIITISFFWGCFFLVREKWQKILGFLIFLPGLFYDLILTAGIHPSDMTEYLISRIFLVFGLAVGAFLIVRKQKSLGIILIILLICATLLSLFLRSLSL